MESLAGILYIGVMLYLASYQEATRRLNPLVGTMMNGLVVGMGVLGLTVLMSVVAPLPDAPHIDPLSGIVFVLMCIVVMVFSAGVVNLPGVRLALADALKRRKSQDDKPVYPYKAESSVHTAAVVVAMLVVVYYGFIFVMAGGLPGISRALQDTPPSPGSMLTDFVVNMAITLLGIGLFIRRNTTQALNRLNITFNPRHLMAGLLAGIGLFIIEYLVGNALMQAVPADMAALWNAPSKALFDAFQDAFLLKGLLLALVYGISEEVLYRGALQPVFGIVLTACFFTLMHLQYLFTPYMLIIFAVALVFGVLRRRYSTTAAISAHFIYNFLPFLLVGILPGVF